VLFAALTRRVVEVPALLVAVRRRATPGTCRRWSGLAALRVAAGIRLSGARIAAVTRRAARPWRSGGAGRLVRRRATLAS